MVRVDPTQAEATLCATLIQRPDLLDEVNLSHEDFLDPDLGLIFRTVQWLAERGKPVTSFAIVEKLAKRVDTDKLADITSGILAKPWAIQDTTRIVKDASTRRRLVQTAHRMIEMAETAERIDDDALSEIEKSFAEVSSSVEGETGPVHVSQIADEYMTMLEERVKNKGQLPGVDTGFKQLNVWLHGWRPGDLFVVGARPSMGKTAFALQSAAAGARDSCVVVFSIEMLRYTLMDRMVSAESMIPMFNLMNGNIQDDNWYGITSAVSEIGQRNLFIDDNPYATVPYIRAKLRRIARQNQGMKLVAFVDYLQIVKVSKKGRSRVEEIGLISTELKALAKELQCSIVALAQVNREVEKRADKRPTLSDLRDSGQIEQDADVIMFLYRDEYYNPETPTKGVVEIIVAKNRNGPQGTAKVGFAKEFQRFIDVSEEG